MKNVFILLFAACLSSCVKDKPVTVPSGPVQLNGSKKVFIVNEGNFMNGNASLSLYDPSSGTVTENIYTNNNAGTLGDVAQSMSRIGQYYYIVVNNSGKIVVCDLELKKLGQITGMQSPRYLQQIGNSKAYVSDLYANKIHVLNLNDRTVMANIPMPGWTEKMAMIYNKVFVTNVKRKYLYVINASSDQLIDSIDVGLNVGNIVIDKNDKIWILGSGDKTNNILPFLKRIDPSSLKVEKELLFTSLDSPGNLCLNGKLDTLYFINKHIYRMGIQDASLPVSAFIEKGNRVFYGMCADPLTGKLYVSDAIDYVQKSDILVYGTTGQLITTFKAGINANSFLFD